MSYRGAQYFYSTIFKTLGTDPTDQHKKWARQFWKDSQQFDFSPLDMNINSTLIKLGIPKSEIYAGYTEEEIQEMEKEEEEE